MKRDEKKNEELQSRREFFKSAAKKTLPILGALVLAGMPTVLKAAEKQPSGCEWLCENSCKTDCEGGCKGWCEGSCKYSCENTCKGTCEGECYVSCEATCKGSCEETCRGNCEGTCKYTSSLF